MISSDFSDEKIILLKGKIGTQFLNDSGLNDTEKLIELTKSETLQYKTILQKLIGSGYIKNNALGASEGH